MKIRNGLSSKKRLSILLVSLALFPTAMIAEKAPLSSFTADQVATLQWGTKAKQVALSQVPANNFGPQTLAVNDLETALYLLDAVNQKIVVINLKDNKISSIPLSLNAVDDMCLSSHDRLHLLLGEEKKIAVCNTDGTVIKTLSIHHDIATPIGIHCLHPQGVVIEAFDGHFYKANEPKPLNVIPLGPYQFSIEPRSSTEWHLQRKHQNDSNNTQLFSIKVHSGTLATLDLIGVDQTDHFYLTIEKSLTEGSISGKIVRLLRKYAPSGKLIAEVELPYSLYAYTLKDIVITASGRIFQILPLKSNFEIVEWQIARHGQHSKGQKDQSSGYYQNLFSSSKEQTDDFYPSETSSNTSTRPSQPKDSPKNTSRQEIIAKAKEYANYRFSVSSNNLTSASGQFLGGKRVITPLRTAGTYTGMPYKWGGDDSFESFQSGLSSGKKAGDKCAKSCSKDSPASDEAVGIDCSGLISRVWNLNGKYGTSNLPDISILLPSNEALQPGDILNKLGHVRLFSHKDARGRFFVYEATGKNNYWKVVGRSYHLSGLQSYQPYRYQGISDSSFVSPEPPIVVPSPSSVVPPKRPVGQPSAPSILHPKVPVTSIRKTHPLIEEPLTPKDR